MNPILTAWNDAPEQTALSAMLACCGATRWATAMVAARPIPTPQSLYETADTIWSEMQESDWLQAFACHPRIGSRKPAQHASTQSASWSNQEQSSTQSATEQTLAHLVILNTQYEERFGFTYIVCATGKSADEMLAILERRLSSDRPTELSEAAEQQRQITHIRLKKWLTE
ncbi:2-oxo-4-hydroxy-4-carboxy-5-ureidoimidazoline decarboxylase [Terracidiphilus gabretensis]|uniref:2-oxo-4-hydroxy-4-carboxy-5-ureidoimidazoline decarboxylase n=1 Tax=Terracidiphilus gabretensis TaxID=1577687 RepID=UPI00071B7F4C|nr:2-oxo-4-hydroxy-4-carboxy-5-ureidoimidazoline decarboxylase [Terracidiphilus gabretensis]